MQNINNFKVKTIEGKVLDRFGSSTKPMSIENVIEKFFK